MQASVESTTDLARHIYIRPPREQADPEFYLLRLRKALYGFSDSEENSNETLSRTLKEYIGLTSDTGDSEQHYDPNGAPHGMQGMVVTQVGDVQGAGSQDLNELTLKLEAIFTFKPRERPLKFVDVRISNASPQNIYLTSAHIRGTPIPFYRWTPHLTPFDL